MNTTIKSHDIGLLFKLIVLEQRESTSDSAAAYTARALEQETGISKSQVSLSLNRCFELGLAKKDRKLAVSRANARALFEFIVYGMKYVLFVKPGELTRGMATAFAAPVLQGKLMSAGEFQQVWPDARSDGSGLAVEPLFKTAPEAAKKDPDLYALLALVDAIRVAQSRERRLRLAIELLKERLVAGSSSTKSRPFPSLYSATSLKNLLN